ncbi:hypothetical protein CLU79DRAFT_752975 [Phycomyces nitens]|nr:hypothetical protein CLU79DRAFT_752975 [Phycomyces nitens]
MALLDARLCQQKEKADRTTQPNDEDEDEDEVEDDDVALSSFLTKMKVDQSPQALWAYPQSQPVLGPDWVDPYTNAYYTQQYHQQQYLHLQYLQSQSWQSSQPQRMYAQPSNHQRARPRTQTSIGSIGTVGHNGRDGPHRLSSSTPLPSLSTTSSSSTSTARHSKDGPPPSQQRRSSGPKRRPNPSVVSSSPMDSPRRSSVLSEPASIFSDVTTTTSSSATSNSTQAQSLAKRSLSKRLKRVFSIGGRAQEPDDSLKSAKMTRRRSFGSLSGFFQKSPQDPNGDKDIPITSSSKQDTCIETSLGSQSIASHKQRPSQIRTQASIRSPTKKNHKAHKLASDPSTDKHTRRLLFCPTLQLHETFAASEYDRRCDSNATCQRLTPALAMHIKQELNDFKLTEMAVHIESRQYTHFFL